MRNAVVIALLATAVGCGGSEPAPAPAPPPAPEAKPAPEPEPEPEPAAEEPAAAADDGFADLSEDEQKAKLMTLGEQVYKTGGSGGVACITCHQENGKGLPPSFPPLAGSSKAMGDCATHAGFVINGLKGEIEVQGTKYNGVMPAQGNLSDLEIAAVVSYERNSWGNADGYCMPADVAAAR